jgi:MerR family mercuric resistance operon transcriptional regulator
MRIGQLARSAGVSVETVRYYERLELLEAAPRAATSGYRVFPSTALRQLRFIRRLQELGFSLGEIRDLLGLRATPATPAVAVRDRMQQKLQDVERKIADLARIATTLQKLTASCDGTGSVRTCVILDALDLGEEESAEEDEAGEAVVAAARRRRSA